MDPIPNTGPGAVHTATKVGLASPRFHAFLIAQFLGALNDSAFKMTLILFALSVVSGEAREVRYTSAATALYPVPFLLFSPLAGYFADRFSKHRVLFWTKWPEILAMALATAGFYFGSVPFLLFVLFFTATHSAFFSPAKYGILPEVFADRDLSSANGILELTTDLAILIGSIAGVSLYRLFRADLVLAGTVFVVIACLGTITIFFAPQAPAGNRNATFVWNAASSFRRDLAEVARIPALYYAVLGIAWFGFLGSFFLAVIPVFGKSVLNLGESGAGVMLAILSIGVGAGAVTAGRLSRDHVELGLVPLGSAGVTIAALMLARAGNAHPLPGIRIPLGAAADLTLLGLASGFFILPLNAMLQQRAPAGMKGRLIAFSNVLTFSAVLAAAGLPWILTGVLGLATRTAILVVAALTLAGTIYVMRMLPDFFVRLVVWMLTNTIYRIRTVGRDQAPTEGALIVANHVSWVDGLLVAGSTGRMVRFLIYRPYYEWKLLNWFFRMMHAIPVAASDSPQKIAQSLALASREIHDGHAVCIFAEGSISRTGNLLRFRRGLERIAAGVDCPIVPVYLDGVWGSLFSYERGRFLFKWPRRIREPVTLFFGAPMPSNTAADQVRQAIQELSVAAFSSRKASQRPLHVAFIVRAKKRWRRTLACDSSGARLSFGAALARGIAMSRALFGDAGMQDARIGVLMPPGIEAMLANFAVWFAGGVPVNLDLNESAPEARHIVESTRFHRIISTGDRAASSAFAPACESGLLLDLATASASITAPRLFMLKALLRVMTARMIARTFVKGDRHDVDRLATILYSYPASAPAQPRGAMLTHHNLLSNLESLRQVFHVTRGDSILGLMSFANSIGFTGTLLLPALTGAKAAYLVPPGDGGALGRLCHEARVTLIPASPEIVRAILELVAADDLRKLRHVAVGGGLLDDQLRDAFRDKFGIEPLEGYGCPECAPIVSLNIPGYDRGPQRQPGARRGTVGQPLPGISVRIADPQTGAAMPYGKEGILLVRGPNVMRGYVDGGESAQPTLSGGWYVTGDFGSVDADGFLSIRRAAHQK